MPPPVSPISAISGGGGYGHGHGVFLTQGGTLVNYGSISASGYRAEGVYLQHGSDIVVNKATG